MDFLLDTRGRQWIKSVFLLYLFVVRILGDCTRPTLAENIVLSNEALLMNYFPDNTVVSLECANGYVLDDGSGTMKCTDGTWSVPDLTCKKRDCGQPQPQPHMIFDISQGTLFGALATVTCDKGYAITGSSYKQCFNSGWFGRAKCEIITCDKPFNITNGRSSWDSADEPKYGEYIQYFCDEGYTLVGKDMLLCNEDGEYDITPPRCQGVTKGDVFTTKMVTPTSTPPAQETSTDSQDTSTSYREKTPTATASPTVSLSERGGGDILAAEDHTTSTITSTITPLFREEDDGMVDMSKDVGYTPVIISVVFVSLVVCIAVLFIHKLLKRKGSYDTREDLKPELLQFQNL